MKPIIFVHHSRLDSGVFSGRKGDIAAAYCAVALSSDGGRAPAPPRVPVFRHEGRLWTTDHCGSFQQYSNAFCHPLILPESYIGHDSVPYSYEGRRVLYQRRTCRLGPKTEFRSLELTVSEWRESLRRRYQQGGYFTSGKTYHDLLREKLADEVWDGDVRAYKPLVGNIVAAIRLELQKPDYDKWKSSPAPLPPAPDCQMNLFAYSNVNL